jgi:peptidylprolyl isomerase
MKKLLIVCSFSLVTAVLLVQCRGNKNSANNNNNNTVQTRNTTMERIKTASGLEYEIIEEGSGESPRPGNMVTVHYTGWLDKNGQPSGQPFDSSHNRRQPFTFQIGVGMVIQGWDEGVMTMKPGEKRRLYIPSKLGYGARGAGSVIPGNADLIFDVELINFA